jgi:hypothetical protein
MSDEFLAEIYAVRKELMEACGHDLKGLGELLKRSQDKDPSHLVTEVPATEPELRRVRGNDSQARDSASTANDTQDRRHYVPALVRGRNRG